MFLFREQLVGLRTNSPAAVAVLIFLQAFTLGKDYVDTTINWGLHATSSTCFSNSA